MPMWRPQLALAESELFTTGELRAAKPTPSMIQVSPRPSLIVARAYGRATTSNGWHADFPADALPQAFLYQRESRCTQWRHRRGRALGAKHRCRRRRDDAYWSAATLAVLNAKQSEHLLCGQCPTFRRLAFAGVMLSCREFRKAESCWDACIALKANDEWSCYLRSQACLKLNKWSERSKTRRVRGKASESSPRL